MYSDPLRCFCRSLQLRLLRCTSGLPSPLCFRIFRTSPIGAHTLGQPSRSRDLPNLLQYYTVRSYFLSSLRVRFMSRELCTHGLVCLPDLCREKYTVRAQCTVAHRMVYTASTATLTCLNYGKSKFVVYWVWKRETVGAARQDMSTGCGL